MIVGGGFLFMDDRKAFNFYRSYYDIALQLNDDDRYQFLMALLDMQFTGETKRQLSPMAQFAFISQKHSIDAQIEGFKTGKLGGYKAHKDAPYKGGYKAPFPQVQEQGQEQEKEQGQAGKNIVFGTPSETTPMFILSSKYATGNNYSVHGEDGYHKLIESVGLRVSSHEKTYVKQFMREKDGCMFKGDIDFVINSFKNYINNLYKN